MGQPMTLRELHKTAEFYISQLRDYEEDPHVPITLEEPSVGGRAFPRGQHKEVQGTICMSRLNP